MKLDIAMTASFKNIKQILLLGLCIAVHCNVIAQTYSLSNELTVRYLNNFQNYVYTKLDADSAYLCLTKIAHNDLSALKDFLHASFALFLIQGPRADDPVTNKIKEKILLNIMSDTVKLLQETARPIYLCYEIHSAKNNVSELKKITEEFLKNELSQDLFYANKTGRYGLMIYQKIAIQEELKPEAKRLFTKIKSILRKNRVLVQTSPSGSNLNKQKWYYYRYLYSYVNYLESMQNSDLHKKELFLKKAFDYSPDRIENEHQLAYFNENLLFFNGEIQTIKNDYIQFLIHSDIDAKKVLSTLVHIALAEPEYKYKLKEFYESNNLSGLSFNEFWMNAIDSKSKKAYPFLFKKIDGKIFSSKEMLGKWILVEFWGTWCPACRDEHPGLQQFYDSVILKNTEHINMLTIACRDKEDSVITYLKRNNYSFPVAMADKNIGHNFNVEYYPTNILITPKGKYITIPFGIDWIKFIKEYCDL